MYEEHNVFRKTTDENCKIWRYLDFTKFVSLLDKQSLYFSRIDKLEDPYEGIYPNPTRCQWNELEPRFKESIKYIELYNKKVNFINSWHINDYESAAMWKIYLKSDEGVAIQSTFNRLAQSFGDTREVVYIGEVDYIDYNSQSIQFDNCFRPLLCKRKSFEYEHEWRAVYFYPNPEAPKELGLNIHIDLSHLIDKIYVAPTSEDWFKELVDSILNKYKIDIEINRSDLTVVR